MFKRFISYYGPEKGLFIADTVCALTYAGIDLAFPIILRALTGGLFTEGAAAIMGGLLFLGLGLVGALYRSYGMHLFRLRTGAHHGCSHGVAHARGPVRPVRALQLRLL